MAKHNTHVKQTYYSGTQDRQNLLMWDLGFIKYKMQNNY